MATSLTQDRYGFAGGNPINNIEFDGRCSNPGDGPCQPLPHSPGANRKNRRRVAQRQQHHLQVQSEGDHPVWASHPHSDNSSDPTHGQRPIAPPEILPQFREQLLDPPGKDASDYLGEGINAVANTAGDASNAAGDAADWVAG